MRLKMKKIIDTRLAPSPIQREYDNLLIEIIDSLPEEYQKFDLSPSTSNKSNLILYDHERNEFAKENDGMLPVNEVKNFLNLVAKELKKKDLVLIRDRRSSTSAISIYNIITKEEFDKRQEKLNALNQAELEQEQEKKSKIENYNSEIQRTINEMNERFGNVIIFSDPPYRENRTTGRVSFSFRYNPQSPDLNDDIKLEIRNYVSNVDIEIPNRNYY